MMGADIHGRGDLLLDPGGGYSLPWFWIHAATSWSMELCVDLCVMELMGES